MVGTWCATEAAGIVQTAEEKVTTDAAADAFRVAVARADGDGTRRRLARTELQRRGV